MIHITLPDATVKTFPAAVTVETIAASIGSGLAKATVAAKVNDKLVDTFFEVTEDAAVTLITAASAEGLAIIRHSAAHLLAYAVKTLYPAAELTIGPAIADGFYYDFALEQTFTPADLTVIAAKMQELARENFPSSRREISREAAREFFRKRGEPYKVKIIDDIPATETLSLYQMGDFVDLCRGPHVPCTDFLKHFALLKVAGAYWRGDSNNEMLQRIYGTAWAKKEDLKTYLVRLEEAKLRDHRKLGKELDLFHLQEEAPGMIFWHPKGWALWQTIEQYLRRELAAADYLEIKTPLIMDRALWEKSGHWDNYQENMFITESEKRVYAVKPMSCPAHIEVFKKRVRSYRELPLRLAEFGNCHRNEPSGALLGLMRVRGFTQDDAHIFCTEAQIETEVAKFNQLIVKVYQTFGFDQVAVKLSLRPAARAGSDTVWDKAEQGLRNALSSCGLTWEELPGEGAFYGPKVEYHIRDAIGRSWQCGTIQLDFVLPERLGAEYTNEHNARSIPVMLHRAIIGSFERFIGILLEHYSGQLPLWLAPTQIAVLTISDRQQDYAAEIKKELSGAGLKTVLDLRNEKIGFKIRESRLQKIPYLVIIGDQEKEHGTIAVRHGQEDLGIMTPAALITALQTKITAYA